MLNQTHTIMTKNYTQEHIVHIVIIDPDEL